MSDSNNNEKYDGLRGNQNAAKAGGGKSTEARIVLSVPEDVKAEVVGEAKRRGMSVIEYLLYDKSRGFRVEMLKKRKWQSGEVVKTIADAGDLEDLLDLLELDRVAGEDVMDLKDVLVD